MADFIFDMQRSISPCKDCSDRKVGCHGQCQRYNEWLESERVRLKDVNEKRMAERDTDDYLVRLARDRRKDKSSHKYGMRGKKGRGAR